MTAQPPSSQAKILLDGLRDGAPTPALQALLRWVLDASAERQGPEVPRTRRLGVLAAALEAHPDRTVIIERLRDLWDERSMVRLLAETGLPTTPSIFREAIGRMMDRVVPRLQPPDDLFVLLARLPLGEPDAEWVASLPAEALAEWGPVLRPSERSLLDAASVTAIRVGALGLHRELIELNPRGRDTDSPFFRLPGIVLAFSDRPHDATARREWEYCLEHCRNALEDAHARLEVRGVSLDLVFRLELLEALLERLDVLLRLASSNGDGRGFVAELVRGSYRQRGIRSLARISTRRLAQKVTEHTGQTGEHYLVSTRADWRAIGWSAAGGGALTAFTALGKYGLSALPLAPMIMGLGITLNYTASFVLMQFVGFTLASKQPAMTAAALASTMARGSTDDDVELVAAITRSQAVATLGNVLVAIPCALLLEFVWRRLSGVSILSAGTAGHSLHGLHPFLSWTIPLAILTGVFLWLASLGAGWAGNWSAFRQLPEALAVSPRLQRTLGARRTAALGRLVDRHLSGIVGYVCLGFLLGFMPSVFAFMGLPIEARHVTLSAASLALSAGALLSAGELHWLDAAWGLAGISVIGVCNFGVSFYLALRTAMDARAMGRRERAELLARLGHEFRVAPGRFLWRPKE